MTLVVAARWCAAAQQITSRQSSIGPFTCLIQRTSYHAKRLAYNCACLKLQFTGAAHTAGALYAAVVAVHRCYFVSMGMHTNHPTFLVAFNSVSDTCAVAAATVFHPTDNLFAAKQRVWLYSVLLPMLIPSDQPLIPVGCASSVFDLRWRCPTTAAHLARPHRPPPTINLQGSPCNAVPALC
jgi:hypothetical protein